MRLAGEVLVDDAIGLLFVDAHTVDASSGRLLRLQLQQTDHSVTCAALQQVALHRFDNLFGEKKTTY